MLGKNITMVRINVCLACVYKKYGLKSRLPLGHTCGKVWRAIDDKTANVKDEKDMNKDFEQLTEDNSNTTFLI